MSVTSTQITVVGRLVTEVETRATASGHKVADFRLLSQERKYDKAQNLWTDGDRLYMTVVCWEAMADRAADSLRKGDHVVVHGRLKLHDYTTEEGARRTTLEVNAKAIGPDLAFHSVMLNRQGLSISPYQQELQEPPRTEPTDEIPATTRTDAAQAA
jgi:single-strand DNA-binding protein